LAPTPFNCESRYCVGAGVGGAGTPTGCGAGVVGEGVGVGVGVGVGRRKKRGSVGVGVGTAGSGTNTEMRNPKTMLMATSRLIIQKAISVQLRRRRLGRHPIPFAPSRNHDEPLPHIIPQLCFFKKRR
jgi:hypothetical protein